MMGGTLGETIPRGANPEHGEIHQHKFKLSSGCTGIELPEVGFCCYCQCEWMSYGKGRNQDHGWASVRVI